ncbi:hypothetical protein AB4142_39410, partial [Variovorax sp. 2RAF20]
MPRLLVFQHVAAEPLGTLDPLIRKRVQQLAEKIQQVIGPFGYRAFVDSAPVLEKAIAEQAGLG